MGDFEVKQEECAGWCLVVLMVVSYVPFHLALCGSDDSHSVFDS